MKSPVLEKKSLRTKTTNHQDVTLCNIQAKILRKNSDDTYDVEIISSQTLTEVLPKLIKVPCGLISLVYRRSGFSLESRRNLQEGTEVTLGVFSVVEKDGLSYLRSEYCVSNSIPLFSVSLDKELLIV